MKTSLSAPAEVVTPALLRHARATYALAMRQAPAQAGYDDIPKNGLYVIGGFALGVGKVPLSELIRSMRISKQAASQLVDTLVTRGYLHRAVDEGDRRKLTVTLTERGAAAAAVQAGARETVDAALIASVGKDHVRIMRQTLAALVDIGHRHGHAGDTRASKPA